MEKIMTLRLTRILRVLILVTLVCNLLALLLVPGFVGMRGIAGFLDGAGQEQGLPRPVLFLIACWQYIPRIWREGPHQVVLTLFLLTCGVCTAVILWQGKRVLDTILRGAPFCGGNAGNLKRAAVCCFLISAFALARVLWGAWFYQSIRPLLTYCGLFVPIFLMAGLLCLVMSALFGQAARMKAENDLTI